MFLNANPFITCYDGGLIPADIKLPISVAAQDDKMFGEVITAASYLPRVQLFGGNSDAVKEGKIGVGRFGLVRTKDAIEDLTAEVAVFPVTYRFKAIQILDGNVLSYHNPKTDEFQDIQAKSEVKDSGCMYGVEFLIWVPSSNTFATFFLSSKTSRRQAGPLRELQQSRQAATLKVELITKGKFKWHGPVVVACSSPINMPPIEEIISQAETFANVKDSVVEKADASVESRAQ